MPWALDNCFHVGPFSQSMTADSFTQINPKGNEDTMAKKAKAAAKTPKAKAPKTPKTKASAPGASGIGHNSGKGLSVDEERALFLQNRTAWNGWQAKAKALKELERDVKTTLKGDGFTVKQMQIADSLATVKGEIKITGEVKDRLKVARWIGHPMGLQLDLFSEPDRTPSVDRSFDAGKQASMENQPRKAPHAPETEQAKTWYAGYDEHQATLQNGVGRGKKAAEKTETEDPKEPEAGERVSREEFRKRMSALSEQTADGALPPSKH